MQNEDNDCFKNVVFFRRKRFYTDYSFDALEVISMAKKMNFLDLASWVLCTIAAVHLGLIGAFNYNVFDKLFGTGMVTRTVYIIIGLLGLYSVGHMLQCAKKK